MKKIMDEEELYLKILRDGLSRASHPVFQELLVVAKHIRQNKGYGEKNIIKELASFCSERNPYFNFTLSETTLIKVAKAAIRNPEFRKPRFPIGISLDEIEKIRSVKNFSYQLLLLASLIHAKSSGSSTVFPDTSKDIREIIRLSGERFTVPRFVEELSPIARAAGIFQHINNRHHFYGLMGNPSGDIVLSFGSSGELEDLSAVYRRFIGGIPEWCKLCGEEFLKDNVLNTKKVCPTCLIGK